MPENGSANGSSNGEARGIPIRRITCIQLGGEYPDYCFRLVMPDYGMPLIGTILKQAGYDVNVFMEHVSPPVWDVIAQSDVVCMSTLSAGAGKTYALADQIRAELGIPVIMGGTHATYFIGDTLNHCDFVVLGEGDETILDLLHALETGGDTTEIPGIAYRDGDQWRKTRTRHGPKEFPTIPDFGLIHGYKQMGRWDMLRERRLPLLTIQSSRGCHFHCTYCIVDTMFSAGYRKRDVESVIADLVDKRKYGKELLFVDNDFAANPRDTRELLQRMIEADLDYDIMVLTRANVAKQDEILELMRRAGVTQIYQGYESVEPTTLKAYEKKMTVDRTVAAIEKLHSYGFRISGSFVVGADTDTAATLPCTTQFVLDNKLTIAYFFPLWGHYFEQKNFNRSIVPRHRAIFRDWAHCDGNFVTHFPLQMRPSQLQRAVMKAHREVFNARTVLDAVRRGKYADAWEKATHRYMWGYIQPGLEEYLPWLEEIEDGLYDAQDHLLEDRLLEAYQGNPPWKFAVDAGPLPGEYVAPMQEPTPISNNIRCVPTAGGGLGSAREAV